MQQHRPRQFESLECRDLLAITPPQLLADTDLGRASGNPRWIGAIQDSQLYVSGGSAPNSLWAADHTQSSNILDLGDSVISNFEVPIPRRQLNSTWAVQNNVSTSGDAYFLAASLTGGDLKLVRTQGTADTSSIAATISSQSPLSGRSSLTVVNDLVFVLAWQQGSGTSSSDELWVSDGSQEGTRFLAEFSAEVLATTMTPFQNELVLSGVSDPDCAECLLWRSDGTVDGTQSIELPGDIESVDGLEIVGENLFFLAVRGNGEKVVMYLDDRLAVKDTGLVLKNTSHVISGDLGQGERYFVFHTDDSTNELRVSWLDDNDRGLLDIPFHSALVTPVFFNNRILFHGRNEQLQMEFYSTDGTSAGTHLYFQESMERDRLENETVVEMATDGTNIFLSTQDAIWISNGTEETTFRFAEIDPLRYSGPLSFVLNPINDTTVLATLRDSEFGTELFKWERESLHGDIDRDFDVDFADFLLLSAAFGDAADEVMATDLNNDGLVDFADFLILADNFGQSLRRE